MATKESKKSQGASAVLPGFGKSLESLSQALAEKGTPGLVLLAIMFFVMWVPVILAFTNAASILKVFQTAPTSDWTHHILPAAVFLLFVGAALFVGYFLGRAIIGNVVPTIAAESSVRSLTSALGGRLVTEGGGIVFAGLTAEQARKLCKDIMKSLVAHTSGLMAAKPSSIRSNVFATDRADGFWMRIADTLEVNMDAAPDRSIAILTGFYSTGTAFAFSKAVFSKPTFESETNTWPYRRSPGTPLNPYTKEILSRQEAEIRKGHPDLRWIISMPIPYQVVPFRLTCGVLNVDSIGTGPDVNETQLREMLRDIACSAALIGVMNRSTDFLEGHCQRPLKGATIEGLDLLGELYKIAWDDFDPAICPEPSREFVSLLSQINGLEFLRTISPTELAEFIRLQLKN
jgi:hypothetical protein